MNAPITPLVPGAPRPGSGLIETIVDTYAQVGDGLNDQDLTCLLLASGLPTEAGFAFLSFSDHCATLGVPPQDLGDWYSPGGRVAPEKAQLATTIAAKYQLALYQPPDRDRDVFPLLHEPAIHHHLELTNYAGTVVAVHPRYLRIRLLAARPGTRGLQSIPLMPLHLGPGLLPDLSSLYRVAAGREVPRGLDGLRLETAPQLSPGTRNLGEPWRASGALREEMIQDSRSWAAI